MNDFVHDTWGYFIAIIAVGGIAWCVWLLYTQRGWLGSAPRGSQAASDTGHVWDGDLTELNNPVPRWWVWMYLLLCAFAVGYLVLYPGLGNYGGALGYSTADDLQRDRDRQAEAVRPLYEKYAAMPFEQIAADPLARDIGQRLFLNACAQCHGSDARGGPGFPNLADRDWLYGGTPEAIVQTIAKGRHGVMPPWKDAIDPRTAGEIAHYVRSMSGLAADPLKVFRGKREYAKYCVACHGVDGKGNQALGAPNLSDDVWLYGSAEATIVRTILEGRDNRMPAHEDVLTPEQIRILGAWVWGLSNDKGSAGTAAARP